MSPARVACSLLQAKSTPFYFEPELKPGDYRLRLTSTLRPRPTTWRWMCWEFHGLQSPKKGVIRTLIEAPIGVISPINRAQISQCDQSHIRL